ncbi:MAG: response regulator, partial [Acidimicrobiia bacterium]|nr:response regulator [Acidimicrobiia bacterium]
MIEQARERISDPAIPPPGSRPPCLLAPAREAIVLVVEDDDLVGEVVARYLRRDGYAVEVARDGPSALRLAARVCPDLVVLDLGLPGMHGLDVLRCLREEALTPVIVLSALGRESDLITGLETGADDYLAKPFSMEEMV